MGKNRPKRPLNELAEGFRHRTLATLRLASKMGLQVLKKTLPLEEAVKPVNEEDAVRAATALLEQLDGLKGLVMKFGQMASYLSPTLPPKAQRILARLQDQSQPMAYERIADVIREDLGRGPEELFDLFDPEPFAAASIGQVHRAALAGRELAVKVQYPGMGRLLESDIKSIGRFARLFFMLSPFDTKGLVGELAERVREECDYRAEAENQVLFRRLLQGERAAVPAVVDDRCSRRVLTTEFARGLGFNTFCDEADQKRRDDAGAVIFDMAYSCILHHCVYNADPHPGNYLFADDGRVIFIDFGCIKRFQPDFIDRWKRIATVVLNGDRKQFKEALDPTGLVARPKRFDYDYHWDVMQYVYQPVLSATPFTFTHDYVRRSYNLILFKNPNRFSTGLPPDWLFVNRLQWGLNSVLAALNATGPWPDLFRRAVESETKPAW